ncbi:MAG: protein kinase domain-containing protein [Gemmatimonadales bacterium]
MSKRDRGPGTATQRWERLNEIFHAAAALPRGERTTFLESACAEDAVLRAEVQQLIAAHERAAGFIEAPALAGAGAWLEEDIRAPVAGWRLGPYRVEREIGRGGMGTVYLAHRADGQYEQQVAIKLIKRGMDTDLVLERFRAERQILASLDHPNIARLMDGGTTDDARPYFVMEYIEGKPIDEYADAHRLTVPERLRLFLQVCGAVAYAHTRLIVHRDIKPVNILITAEGVPKLLDFGIAKVLHPGMDEATASVTGFRLLTPEYASPEQVEGRPATTASDIYSLGVVLYELLTGRSPYRLRSRALADVAEAVQTTEPERPSLAVTRPEAAATAVPRRAGLNPDRAAASSLGTTAKLGRLLRRDLDEIVLTALRKEPARRYGSVELFAEDIRRHLDGLPVRARPDGVLYRTGKFLRRNRSSVFAAALAACVAVALAGTFIAFRGRSQDDMASSLLSTGALARRDRLLVADFTDLARDSTLARALTEAFRTDLTQSPLVQVMTPRQVRSSLMRMERSPEAVLDDSLAREIAVRDGVKALVSGSVARVGAGYTLSVQLISAQQGEALTGLRETARDSSQLIAAVDRASKGLRHRIGESLRALNEMPPLSEVTTASLPALRRYTEGSRLFVAGDRTAAIRSYEEAVAIDTGFATAYEAMAKVYGALAEPGRAFAAGQHAMANQARLSLREREVQLASSAYGTGDYRTAVARYGRLLERYPDDAAALSNMALAYRDWRKFATAESVYRRATRADSTIPVIYYGLHSAQLLQGKFADSRRTLDLIAQRFPKDRSLPFVEVNDATARQHWDEAERLAKARIAAHRGDTLQLVDGFEALAGIVMTRGRLAEAARHWRTQLALAAAAGSWGRHLFGVQQLGYLQLRFQGAPAVARALMDSALARHPLEQVLPGDRPYYELARFYAALRDVPRARTLLASADSTDRALGRHRPADRSWTRGAIAFAAGRMNEAEIELRQAAETDFCAICPLPDLARVYEAVGERDSARVTYERYLATPWLFRYEIDAIELGWTMKRLGELYEERGERDKAAAAFSGLSKLWGRADPELQAVVAQARRAAEPPGPLP